MLLFLVLLLCTLWELYALFFNILLFTYQKKKKNFIHNLFMILKFELLNVLQPQ